MTPSDIYEPYYKNCASPKLCFVTYIRHQTALKEFGVRRPTCRFFVDLKERDLRLLLS